MSCSLSSICDEDAGLLFDYTSMNRSGSMVFYCWINLLLFVSQLANLLSIEERFSVINESV